MKRDKAMRPSVKPSTDSVSSSSSLIVPRSRAIPRGILNGIIRRMRLAREKARWASFRGDEVVNNVSKYRIVGHSVPFMGLNSPNIDLRLSPGSRIIHCYDHFP